MLILAQTGQIVNSDGILLLNEIVNVVEVDPLHFRGRPYYRSDNRQGMDSSTGVLGNGMIQDGFHMNLGDPLYSLLERGEYPKPSQQRRGLDDGKVEVGLTR